MTNTIFSATGCARCAITKRYMQEHAIDYTEYDIKADGKDEFAKFYRENRKAIFRDKDGVEFPVFTDGAVIRQGASVVIGYLIAGDNLSGFIGRNTLHGEWIDGFNISGGNPEYSEKLLQVLTHLKNNGLKIQVVTDGRNATILQDVLAKRLVDRIRMEVRGPAALYGPLTGAPLDENELRQSIALAGRFAQCRFQTTIAPMVSQDGTLNYLTPEEIGETAKMIEAATGSKKYPYLLKRFDTRQAVGPKLEKAEPLPSSAMFKYRTAARRYMVMADIEK